MNEQRPNQTHASVSDEATMKRLACACASVRIPAISVALGVWITFGGCRKHESPSSTSKPVAGEQTNSVSPSTPIAQPALTAWEEGNQAAAVISFVEADWSARPLFAPGSVLNLSEEQFRGLSPGDRQAKSSELVARLDSFKRLVAAVAQAGRDVASKGDVAQARKCFKALDQCGTALDKPERTDLVRIVGRACKRIGSKELAQVRQ